MADMSVAPVVSVTAVGSVKAVQAVETVPSRIACGTADVLPCLAAVEAEIPVTLLDFKLRSDAVSTATAGAAVAAVSTVFADSLDFVAIVIEQPFSVQSPVPQAVLILHHADYGH